MKMNLTTKNIESYLQRMPFALALLVNIMLFLAHYGLADLLYFSEKEIEWVSRIVTGTWFTPNANTVLNNLLVFLYENYPNTSWYAITISVTLFPAYVGIAYLFFERKTSWQSVFLYVAFFMIFGFLANSRVSVEIAAGFSALSGILLLILSGSDEKSNTVRQILGAILAAWSGVLSWTAFGLMVMIVLPFWLIRLQKEPQGKTLFAGSLLAIVVLISLATDWYSYSANSGNSDIIREQVLSSLRSKISTLKLTEDELNFNLSKAGISLNDYALLKKDFMLNDQKVNIRSMSAFLSNQSYASEFETLLNYFRNLSKELPIRKLTGFAMLFFALSILFVKWNYEQIRILVISTISALIWLFLFYGYSYTNLDSSYLTPVLMYLSLLPCLQLTEEHHLLLFTKSRNVLFSALGIITIACILIASTHPLEKRTLRAEREQGHQDWLSFDKMVKEKSNLLFVVWGNHHFESYFSAHESLTFFGEKNVLWLKNDQQSKKTADRLDIFFLKELPLDFLKKEHAYLVLPNHEYEELKNLMITYFSEHYHIAVRLEKTQDFNHFSVVRLVEY